jgi:protein-disulfide isomerase-like protein with CxxC motif
MTRAFALTWDYRCPFARIAHDHVLTGLASGADWDVQFVPFSLGQAHVVDGQPDVWDAPHTDSGLLALQASVVVRDRWPEHFLAVHRALFELRHDNGGSLRDRRVLGEVLEACGVDQTKVWGEVDGGWPLAAVRAEHEQWAASHHVWGVPTFIVATSASFVRLLDGPDGDAEVAVRTVERIVDLLGWSELNEFKHTSIPR